MVLFISSHGYADLKGGFHVVPYDTGASMGVTEDLLNTCLRDGQDKSAHCETARGFLARTISSQDFDAWWTGVDAGQMVMILDSCHSAALPGKEFRPAPLGDPGFGQLSYDKGLRILSATLPDRTARAAYFQGEGHSMLVEALLRVSKEHDQQSLAEWLRFIKSEIPVLTRQLYPELDETQVQIPELFDFAVAERHRVKSGSDDNSE